MVEKLKKLKVWNDNILFIACKNRKRSALVRELLSNNSLFVSQLYAALRARDLICFNTGLQTVNYYTTTHC